MGKHMQHAQQTTVLTSTEATTWLVTESWAPPRLVLEVNQVGGNEAGEYKDP